MDAAEARDHLRMVDGIVRTTHRSPYVPPTILLTIGLISAITTGLIQARQMGLPIPPDQYLQPPLFLFLIAVLFTIAWRGRRAGRAALVDSYAGAAFLIAALVGFTLNVTAQHRIVSAEGIGLFWAASFSSALLIIGAMGNGLLLVSGAAMLVAIAAASLVQGWLAGLLSVAWLVGFAAPAIVLAWRTSRGRAATV